MIDVSSLSSSRASGFVGAKRRVLHDVTFSIAAGSVCGLVGPNGAGKSTTIRHLVGIARPSSGTVRVGGKDPAEKETRALLGYAPELPSLPAALTASELLELHARLRGVAPDFSLLERLDLGARAREPISQFSKGMVQRLTLALALIGAPPLLILDEPMSGLDPVGREQVRALIRDEQKRGATVLLSSHVLSDVARVCDQVVVICKGRVVLDEKVTKQKVESYDVTFDDGHTQRMPLSELGRALQAAEDKSVVSVEPVRTSLEDRVLAAIQGASSPGAA